MRSNCSRALTIIAACLLVIPAAALDDGTVKVFILAGQSNMEGKAQNPLWEHQATDQKTAPHFAHLRKGQNWIVRDDAFIKYLGRHGALTIGFGSPGRSGVELEFGTHLAEHFDEPVLLIKTAWGGHSLVRNFRPPSAGLPTEQVLEAELAKGRKRAENRNKQNGRSDPLPTMEEIQAGYGASYRDMLKEVATTFSDFETLFPELRGRQLELTGLVWFQGWNDQYDGAEIEYESNLRHFIADVRRDLEAPQLPLVIGVMGQNGSKPAEGAMLVIQGAQLALAHTPEFEGNVAAVRTDVLIDKAAEALYPTWKENQEQWELTGSDHMYHYLGSAIWHVRMGHAFSEAMLELMTLADSR